MAKVLRCYFQLVIFMSGAEERRKEERGGGVGGSINNTQISVLVLNEV